MIKNCLKPAQINSIDIKDKRAIVVMDDSQKALAIGKWASNIKLAYNLQDTKRNQIRR